MFKNAVLNGDILKGTWQRIPSTAVSEVLALSGFDFVTVDMEHGMLDISDLRGMIPAFKSRKVPVVVRISSREPALISKVLDMGADGIMAPQIQSVDEVREIVRASKYAPLGMRGMGMLCTADDYGNLSPQDFAQQANDQVLTIVQIETVEAVEQLDQLLDVEGVDLFYVGPFDLSQALGILGQMDHPLLTETIQRVVDAVKKKGKAVGMHGSSPEFIRYWRERGVGYFTYGVDLAFLKHGAQIAFHETNFK